MPRSTTPTEPTDETPAPDADTIGPGTDQGDASTEPATAGETYVAEPDQVAEVFAPEPEVPRLKAQAVVLRHHWTDAEGTAHQPGAELEVDGETAETLLAAGYATEQGADAAPVQTGTEGTGEVATE